MSTWKEWTGGNDPTRSLRSGFGGPTESKGRKCFQNEEEFSSTEAG